MITVKRYFKESTIIIVGQILIFIASIFGVKVLTSVMSPSSYGELMLYNTIFIFSSMMLYNPLQQATGRYFNSYYFLGYEKLQVLEAVVIRITKKNYVNNIIVVIIFTICFVFYKGWYSIYGCLFILIYCISYSQFMLYITAFNSLKYRVISSWLPLLERILKPLFGAILIYYIADNTNYALAGQALSGIIVLALAIYFYRLYVNNNHLTEILKVETNEANTDFVDFMRTIPIRTIFLWLFLSCDRWVLEFFNSSKEVGLYSVLNQIGYSPVTQISSVVSIVIGPYIYNSESIKTGYTLFHKKIINYGSMFFVILTLFAFFGAYIFKDYIYEMLIDKEYNSVANLLPFVVLSGGIYSLSQFYGLKALIKLKPQLLVPPSIISAILGVIIYIILGYLYEVRGIVFANLSSNLILFILTFYYCNKHDTKE